MSSCKLIKGKTTMIAPKGYLNFFEIAEWAREIARDIVMAKRRVNSEYGFVVEQVRGERDALQCWAVANLFQNAEVEICSPIGVVLRAPPFLNKHLDQIEILPIPIPIEQSTLILPSFDENVEIEQHCHFIDRFAFFSYKTAA